ncbi:hypothetical protein JX266_008421 [Neoarthrinium moseri]|nr:hypothetical protein JX266_008421 [Neoarthrinium moseri]
MAPTIVVVRHAHAKHNIAPRFSSLIDPDLTLHGERQCEVFSDRNRDLRNSVTHLVASPSWRTIRTAILAFGIDDGQEVIVHPDIQEVADSPCNIPRDRDTIEDLGGEFVNTDLLLDGFNDRGPDSRYRYNFEAVLERARTMRIWLRHLARSHDSDDAVISVVTHGGFAPFLTQGDVLPWSNMQSRSYRFVDPDGDDDEAALELIDGDSGADPSGGAGGGGDGGGHGYPRGILKRRRDDDDDGDTAGGGGAGSPSVPKRTKAVGWAENLEQIREFTSHSVYRLRPRISSSGPDFNGIRKTYHPRRGIDFNKSDFSDTVLRTSSTGPNFNGIQKTFHPRRGIYFNKNESSNTMLLRARQIQRYVDRFENQTSFSLETLKQAIALEPRPWVVGKPGSTYKRGEPEYPMQWDISRPNFKKSIYNFVCRWEWRFIPPRRARVFA